MSSLNRTLTNKNKMRAPNTTRAEATVMVMGPTGTGKSAFIKLLTNDNDVRIGHNLQSQTSDVKTSLYVDPGTGALVTLVDTPGFDDSREGVTDTDILGKIAGFLQEEGRKLNGFIYLHRISDPRMGGQAKKNLRMFGELCGDKVLDNVRIITTFWNRVEPEVGPEHEKELADEVFRPFVDGGAKLFRHDKGLESARLIVSELIYKAPVVTRLQEELAAGKALGDTSAGAVIVEEMKEMQKKHDQEMEDLKREMEGSANADEELQAELAAEVRKLEVLMMREEQDGKTLQTPLLQPTASIDLNMSLRAAHVRQTSDLVRIWHWVLSTYRKSAQFVRQCTGTSHSHL